MSNSGGAQHDCTSKKWGARVDLSTNFQYKWGPRPPLPPGSATPAFITQLSYLLAPNKYIYSFQMETLTDLVQSQFNDLVAQGTWLTEKTKKLAEDKIRAIIHNIGYPDFILDDNLLQTEVQGLNYKTDKFFENVLQNLRWRTEQEMSRLDERVNRTLWTATPAVVNAYYSRNRNQISK